MQVISHYHVGEYHELAGYACLVKSFADYVLDLLGLEDRQSIMSDGSNEKCRSCAGYSKHRLYRGAAAQKILANFRKSRAFPHIERRSLV